MLKIRKASIEKAESYKLTDLFPDISKEMTEKINENIVLKKELIDYVQKDRVGTQFNAVRLCKIPPSPKELAEEVEELEYEFDNMDENDERYSKIKKTLWKKKKELDKLKHPYRYFDDICECYQICPLFNSGIAPEGERCYFEMQKVAQSTEGYLNEFEVDLLTQNVAKEQITQIVLCDLIIYRAERALAVTNLSSISEKVGELGVEYVRQRNHLITLVMEQNKTRNKLLETMLGTPEIRKKYKMDSNKNMKQADAEKATAELIRNRESIKKNRVPNLINFESEKNEIFKIEEAEVIK